MAKKIVGNPTVTPMAVPDWNQTDSSKADYIKNKPPVYEGDSDNTIVHGHTLSNWKPYEVNNKVVEYAENDSKDEYKNENLLPIQTITETLPSGDEIKIVVAGAFGENSVSFGTKSQALGNKSFAEGSKTIAFGNNTHAEGNGTFAVGPHSHSEGSGTTSIGNSSHAQGRDTVAEGDNAHAEGHGTSAIGDNAHAEGYVTEARGEHSHAEGFKTIAQHDDSHTEGIGTVTGGGCQHVQGRWNKAMGGDYAHVVGNGSDDDNRSNAHTLDWNGNAWYAGTVETTGIILKSPNGTRFMLTVSDTGEIATEAILVDSTV